MMVPVQFVQECLPVPGRIHAQVAELIHKLLDDPFFHEFLKRHCTLFKRGVVIHREAREQAEDAPTSPEHNIDQPLCLILSAILHQDFERWFTLLRMTSFIGLNAGDQSPEFDIPYMHSISRHSQELQVRETCFEGKRELES